MRKALLPAASVLGLAILGATPAFAIECDGNFQIQKSGNMISTPYCQDRYLTIVAREYGMSVSFDALRYNPSIKERTCRFVGDDNRVKDTCGQYMNHDRDSHWY